MLISNSLSAGDAAHSFPPTGGLGLNCGIADVHNLAYKIALVHQEVASPTILLKYTAERRSVADAYSKQSVKNGKEIFSLLQSLKTAGVEDVTQARKNMMEALADPVQRVKVNKGIEAQQEHFDNVSDVLSITMCYQYPDHLFDSWNCILAMSMEPVSLPLTLHSTPRSSCPGQDCLMLGSNF